MREYYPPSVFDVFCDRVLVGVYAGIGFAFAFYAPFVIDCRRNPFLGVFEARPAILVKTTGKGDVRTHLRQQTDKRAAKSTLYKLWNWQTAAKDV